VEGWKAIATIRGGTPERSGWKNQSFAIDKNLGSGAEINDVYKSQERRMTGIGLAGPWHILKEGRKRTEEYAQKKGRTIPRLGEYLGLQKGLDSLNEVKGKEETARGWWKTVLRMNLGREPSKKKKNFE